MRSLINRWNVMYGAWGVFVVVFFAVLAAGLI